MTQEKPKKGYLYTWNFVDGFVGLPKRKIKLSNIKPHLLHIAYLGGGERWDDKGTPSGALLYMILTASQRSQQSSENYYKFYANYNTEGLERAFGVKVEELNGGGCAWWQIYFDSTDWTHKEIDSKIEEVLGWHDKEINKIRKLLIEK